MALFLIERNFAETIELDAGNAEIRRINDDVGVRWLYSFHRGLPGRRWRRARLAVR